METVEKRTITDTVKTAELHPSNSKTPAQYRDRFGCVITIRPYEHRDQVLYAPYRLQNGDWQRVNTGGNYRPTADIECAEEQLADHADFMGWQLLDESEVVD